MEELTMFKSRGMIALVALLWVTSTADAAIECEYSSARSPGSVPGYLEPIACLAGQASVAGTRIEHSGNYRMNYGTYSNDECGLNGSGWHISGVDSCQKGTGGKIVGCSRVYLRIDGDNCPN
jgi:hypothetical protein